MRELDVLAFFHNSRISPESMKACIGTTPKWCHDDVIWHGMDARPCFIWCHMMWYDTANQCNTMSTWCQSYMTCMKASQCLALDLLFVGGFQLPLGLKLYFVYMFLHHVFEYRLYIDLRMVFDLLFTRLGDMFVRAFPMQNHEIDDPFRRICSMFPQRKSWHVNEFLSFLDFIVGFDF